jgi:hypothetical protein
MASAMIHTVTGPVSATQLGRTPSTSISPWLAAGGRHAAACPTDAERFAIRVDRIHELQALGYAR